MREHAGKLAVGQLAQQAVGHGDRGIARPADREGVHRLAGHVEQARHAREIGARRKLADDPEQLRPPALIEFTPTEQTEHDAGRHPRHRPQAAG
jgi:hypothetical protein